jgi:hypothetical protein
VPGASPSPSSPPGWELAAPAGWCPDGERILTNKGAYCGHRAPLNWQEARARCQQEGGALAKLETAEEQEALRVKLASRQGIRGDFWLGLRRDEENAWRWVNGAPLAASFWTPGEPNNWGGDEPCVHVYASSGLWNDATCEASLSFLCSLPKKQVAAPGGFRPFRCPGRLLQGRSEAFCFHEEPATWGDARNACAQAGGDLATFAEGADFEALVGGDRAPLRVGRFWLDLTDHAMEGQWLWGEKTPVTAPDWHPGEPNDAGAQEHCGELLIDHWNDMPCDARQGWLCEAP